MQTKLYRIIQSRWVRIAGTLAILLPLVLSLAAAVWRAYAPAFQELSTVDGANTPQATATFTVTPFSTPTHPTPTRPAATSTPPPTPTPTPRPPLALVWSPEYSQVNLRGEPGGVILRLLDNGSPLHLFETHTLRGVEWVHVLASEGQEEIEGWVAASLVFTIQGDLPLAQVSGQEGANLRTEPCGALIAWLPYGTPLQVFETAEVEGAAWAHVILPDDRRGWVAQRLLSTSDP